MASLDKEDLYIKCVANRIPYFLEMKKWDRGDLVRETGIDRKSLYDYCKGIYQPRHKNRKKIANAFGVEIEDIFNLDRTKEIFMEQKPIEYRRAHQLRIIRNNIGKILEEKGLKRIDFQKTANLNFDSIRTYIENSNQPRVTNAKKIVNGFKCHPNEIWYLIPGNEHLTLTFEDFDLNSPSNNEVHLNRIKAYMEEKFPKVTNKSLWLATHTGLPRGAIKNILCNSRQPQGEILAKITEVLKADSKDLIYIGKANSIREILRLKKITHHKLAKKTNIEPKRIQQFCNNEAQPTKEEAILIAKMLKVSVGKLNIPEEIEMTTEISETEDTTEKVNDKPLSTTKPLMTNAEVKTVRLQKELDFKMPNHGLTDPNPKKETRIILKVPEKDLPDECIDIRLALKAKDIGYNEECHNAWKWHGNSPKPTKMTLGKTPKDWNNEKKWQTYYYSAPTQKRLKIWLKETQRISVDYIKISDDQYRYFIGAAFNILYSNEPIIMSDELFTDQTEAMEEGLSKAINALKLL